MLHINVFVDPMFGENTYVVAPEMPGPCWVVDPGLPPSGPDLLEFVDQQELTIEAILCTHAHADHIAGLDLVKDRCPQAKVYLAKAEHGFLTDPDDNMSILAGVSLQMHSAIDHDLPHGAVLTLGRTEWQVLDTAGHSPGGRSFFCPSEGVVFVGDALFDGSIGRTDLPYSSHQGLIRNIQTHLLSLPDETVVYSGHGPTTTIGRERKSNPFLVE